MSHDRDIKHHARQKASAAVEMETAMNTEKNAARQFEDDLAVMSTHV
jgi:hypothetical protein